MPSFTFKGFASASTVALTVAQGAASESATVAAWGQSTGGSQSLTVVEKSAAEVSAVNAYTAPTALWLRAVPSGFSVSDAPLPSVVVAETPFTAPASVYQAAFHEIFYVWTITRPAGAASTFQPPGAWGYNMPTAWNNRNVMYGPLTTLCFDVPGAYTVELWAVDPAGNAATWSKSYTVQDPDVVFAGPLTVCVTPSGNSDYSWAPAGAQLITLAGTDQARVEAAIGVTQASPASTSRRLMFGPPGATFDVTAPNADAGNEILELRSGSAAKRIYLQGAGSGVTLYHGRGNAVRLGRDELAASVTITNLTFRGPWDAETETKDFPVAIPPTNIYAQADTHYTLHKVTLRQGMSCLDPGPDNNVGSSARVLRRFVFSECFLADWCFYATYANPPGNANSRYPAEKGPFGYAYLGTKVVRSPYSLTAPDKWGPDGHHNGYGPLRSMYFDWFHMACSDFFMPGYMQPMFRGPSSVNERITGVERYGYTFANYDRNVLEGAEATFGNGTAGPGATGPTPMNAVVDKMILIGTCETNVLGGFSTATTVRNLLAIVPGTQRPAVRATAVQPIRLPNATGPNDAFANANPIRIHNATIVWLRTPGQNNGGAITDLIQGASTAVTTIENNVLHGPNISLSAGTFVATTLAGVTPRYAGLNQSFIDIQLSLANIGPGGTFDVFYTDAARTAAGQPNAPWISHRGFDGRWPTAAPSAAYWAANPTHNCHNIWTYTGTAPLPTTFPSVAGGGDPPGGSNNGTDVPQQNGLWLFDLGQTAGNRITAAYLTDRIRFTNNSTFTMNGTYRMRVDIRGLHPGPDTSFATPANLPLVWRPAAGSPAIVPGAASGLWAVDDLLGTTRSAPRARGAFAASG